MSTKKTYKIIMDCTNCGVEQTETFPYGKQWKDTTYSLCKNCGCDTLRHK